MIHLLTLSLNIEFPDKVWVTTKAKKLCHCLSVELACALNQMFGGVSYAGVDTDPELGYPRGGARLIFDNIHSYVKAISSPLLRFRFGGQEKLVQFIFTCLCVCGCVSFFFPPFAHA